jgi:hypothetical protein
VDRKRFVAVVIAFLVLIAVARILLNVQGHGTGIRRTRPRGRRDRIGGPGYLRAGPFAAPAHPHRNWYSALPGWGAIPQLARK